MKRKHLAATAVLALAAIAALGAYAYWTSGGSGSGTATAGTAVDITVNQAPVSGVVPGGSVALGGTFTNGNTFPVYVGSVTAKVGAFSEQADGAKPACTEDDFSITGSAAVGAQVAPGTGGSWSGLALAMANSSTNQDNCKGVTVPIEYTVVP